MSTMKKTTKSIFYSFCALLQMLTLGSVALANTGTEFVSVPPFLTSGAPPLVMLAMGRDHKLYYEAYNDASDLNEDGVLDIRYTPSIDYYGYFDSYKCYNYNTSTDIFEPTSVNTDKRCTGSEDNKWSGNFLNYLTTARIDAIRKVLYGGYRSVDTASQTVLQRSSIPQDAHSWGKEYTSVAVDGYNIADYTPFTVPFTGLRHLFANTTMAAATNPPSLRYALNSEHRIWDWVSRAAPEVADSAVTAGVSGTLPAYPTNHATFESLIVNYATSSRLLGTTPWLTYANRNKVRQLYPSPTTTTFGAIDGSGNPFKPSTYGPTASNPSSVYNSGSAEQNGFLLVFTGKIKITTAGTYYFGVDGDDSVEVIIDGGTASEHIVGYYGGHGRSASPNCYTSAAVGGVCTSGSNAKAVTLSAGNHTVEFRYMEGSGSDDYYFYWKEPGSSVWGIVPNTAFTELSVTGYFLLNPAVSVVNRYVNVKVCDPTIGLETNCRQYPDGNYKPVGLLQRHGESQQMYFGLITGSYAKSASGGVLRKKIGDISDEIVADTGIFKTAANTSGYKGGIIQTINNLRIYGYNYSGNNYGGDKCGWITTPLYNDNSFMNGQTSTSATGRCGDWGNPIAEIMYESMRYFAGKGAATAAYDYPTTGVYGSTSSIKDEKLSLPHDTWNNPYDKSNGGFDYCSKPFVLVLSDINPNYDTDQLPGVYSDFSTGFTGDMSGMNVANLAKTISDAEGLSGDKYIGQSGSVVEANGAYCSAKSMSSWGLAAFRGLCPEEPTKRGGYYSGAVAYYGKTHDLNTVQGDQKVTTYAVALASPLPEIKMYLGANKKLITLVPFGKTVGTANSPWTYAPTNTIVDYYVEEISATHGNFQINFEDVEQGADHDMDALVTYEYWLVDGTGNEVSDPVNAVQLKVTLTSTQAAGSYIQHLGYIISGTDQDGPYVEVCDADTSTGDDITSPYDTPPGYNTAPGTSSGLKLPKLATRYFTPGTGNSTASLVKNPLWYAGKWGGFEDENANGLADQDSEWDKDLDGVPDNYFFVVNPLKLEEQLNKSFAAILNQASSGTALAVVSGSRTGEGAIYQAVFYPEQTDTSGKSISWTGQLQSLFSDSYSNLREDSNHNAQLDVKGPDLNGDGRVLNEDVNGNCTLDVQTVPTIDVNEDGVLDSSDLLTEDTNGNGVLDYESSTGSCVSATTVAASPFLSAIDAIVVFNNGKVDKYYDVNGNGILDPQEIAFNIGAQGTPINSLSYLWKSSNWLNTISDSDIIQQRGTYISDETKRYIFTWVDAPDASGVRNGIVDSGEVQDFTWDSSASATTIASPNYFYSYLNLYPSFNDRPTAISTVATAYPSLFNTFLLNQTERQVKWLRGLDYTSSGVATPLILSPVGAIPGTELRSRYYNGDTWRLGDIAYSTPTVSRQPNGAYHLAFHDTSYTPFYQKYMNRRSVIYVGGNDGMLHAFNGGFYSSKENKICRALNASYDPYDSLLTNDEPCATSGPELGAELWAYVPYNLLPHLYWLTEANYGHSYYVDGQPRIFDAKIFAEEGTCTSSVTSAGCVHPGGWGTVMVVGMRMGGAAIRADLNKTDGTAVQSTDPLMKSSFIIFDITNPEAPPKLLGEIAMPNMGYSTNYPALTIVKDGNGDKNYAAYDATNPAAGENRWFLDFGSGPANVNGEPDKALLNVVGSEQRGRFYMLDLVQLATYNKLMTLADDTLVDGSVQTGVLKEGLYPYLTLSGDDETQSFVSDSISVDMDTDYNADAIYFGTVSGSAPSAVSGSGWKGKLRRIVIDNKQDPTTWLADNVMFNAGQPISAAPTFAHGRSGRKWVFFGTGRFFSATDALDTSTQSMYGIMEPLAAASGSRSYAEVSSSALVDTTNYKVYGNKTVDMNGTTVTWDNFLSLMRASGGWRIDFLNPTSTVDDTRTVQVGERSLYQPLVAGGAVAFTTFVPSEDICEAGGESFLWGRYYETGTDYYIPIFSSKTVTVGGETLQQNTSVVPAGSGMASNLVLNSGPDGDTVLYQNNGQPKAEDLQLPDPFSKTGKRGWKVKE